MSDDDPGAVEQIRTAIHRAERHANAELVIKKAASEYPDDDLAEICAAVERTVRDESLRRDVNKHGGIACLYMVVDRLAEADPDDAGDAVDVPIDGGDE